MADVQMPLLEKCIKCGMVIRDDRSHVRRGDVFHYHLTPSVVSRDLDGTVVMKVPTVCLDCAPVPFNSVLYWRVARALTPDHYRQGKQKSNASAPFTMPPFEAAVATHLTAYDRVWNTGLRAAEILSDMTAPPTTKRFSELTDEEWEQVERREM